MLRLGWVALEQNQLEQAVHWFKQATEVVPDNSLYFHWLGRAFGSPARQAGIPGGAIPCRRAKAAFDKTVALDPSNIEARYDLMQWFLETPGLVGGSVRRALDEAEQIRKRDPCLGNVAKGKVFEHQGNSAAALASFRAAQALDPRRLEAGYALCYFHMRRGDYEKALAEFEEILALPDAGRSANSS